MQKRRKVKCARAAGKRFFFGCCKNKNYKCAFEAQLREIMKINELGAIIPTFKISLLQKRKNNTVNHNFFFKKCTNRRIELRLLAFSWRRMKIDLSAARIFPGIQTIIYSYIWFHSRFFINSSCNVFSDTVVYYLGFLAAIFITKIVEWL